MKVLSLNIHFLLPDDFNGDLNDAISEIVKYRKGERLQPIHEGVLLDEYDRRDFWKGFLAAISEGYKLHGGIFLGEWDVASGSWKNMSRDLVEK